MSQPNLRVAIYPFEPRLEIRAQMLLAIEEIGMPETSMISPAGPSFAACDQLRRAHRRTCSSADPSRTGSAWRMDSIGRKRPSRHSSSCQRMQMFLFCSYQGFAGALPSLLLREAVTGPAGLGGMASPALLDQHQTAGLVRLGCELKPRPTVSEIGFLGAAMINPTACMCSASSALQSRSVALRT